MKSRIYKEQRDRPRGRYAKDYDNLESLVLIARKHDLDPKRLIDSFFQAFKNKISNCGSLKISCRKIDQDSAMFLITKGENVVWQFPVKLEMITNPEVRDSIRKIPIPEKVKIDKLSKNLKINELQVGMKGVNITANIIDIPPARLVKTRWGTQALVSNVLLADKTGTIRLGLWNDQIEKVHVGDTVEIDNCSVSRFADEPHLKIGRKSTLSVVPELQIVKSLISR